MKYTNVTEGEFVGRNNRFTAEVLIGGVQETVHVKNTGRMKELLFPGARVTLTCSDNPNRKTKYDLISVYKESLGWVNIDSQAPNKVVGEWLAGRDYTFIKPEYKYRFVRNIPDEPGILRSEQSPVPGRSLFAHE